MNKLTCVVCPMGCQMDVNVEDNKLISISGNACKRGELYAKTELFDPRRTLTTTVTVRDGAYPLAPVKSESPLPKNTIRECMEVLRRTHIAAPVETGQVVVEDILGTGINIVACGDVMKI